MPGVADEISDMQLSPATPRQHDESGAAFEPQTGAKQVAPTREMPAGTSSVPAGAAKLSAASLNAVAHDQLRLLEHDLDQLSPTADASAKALPAACVVCANDDPGVSEFQRCDGGCDRWFCIGGSCARDLGVMNYTRDMSGGDLVCGDCADEAASVQKKLKTSSASITTALEQQEFREQ